MAFLHALEILMSSYRCLLFGLNCVIQVPVSVLTSRSPCLQKYPFNEALISLFYNIPAGKKILCTELSGVPAQIFSLVIMCNNNNFFFWKTKFCFSSNSHSAIGVLFMFTSHILCSKYGKIFLISASRPVLQTVWLLYSDTVFSGSWVVELWIAVTICTRNW